MAPQILETADSRNKFEDLSGVDITAYANPYDALIEACNDDPVAHPSATEVTLLPQRGNDVFRSLGCFSFLNYSAIT